MQLNLVGVLYINIDGVSKIDLKIFDQTVYSNFNFSIRCKMSISEGTIKNLEGAKLEQYSGEVSVHGGYAIVMIFNLKSVVLVFAHQTHTHFDAFTATFNMSNPLVLML